MGDDQNKMNSDFIFEDEDALAERLNSLAEKSEATLRPKVSENADKWSSLDEVSEAESIDVLNNDEDSWF